jgi:hypothetical protein
MLPSRAPKGQTLIKPFRPCTAALDTELAKVKGQLTALKDAATADLSVATANAEGDHEFRNLFLFALTIGVWQGVAMDSLKYE